MKNESEITQLLILKYTIFTKKRKKDFIFLWTFSE